jgi:hypothetical protein
MWFFSDTKKDKNYVPEDESEDGRERMRVN